MNSALLVIDRPSPTEQRQAWNGLLSQLRNIVWTETEGILIGEIALVIPTGNGRLILERAVLAAEREGFAHRTMLFDKSSGWGR